jgi:hypothetical protein
MTGFLFWNLCGRRLEQVLGRLTARHVIDVLMLAECAIPEGAMLDALNVAGQGPFRRVPALASRGLDLYSRFERGCFGPVLKEADHYLIRTMTPPRGIEIVLALAHLASPRFKDRPARHSRLIGFASTKRENGGLPSRIGRYGFPGTAPDLAGFSSRSGESVPSHGFSILAVFPFGASDIRGAERAAANDRTIVVGDLNVNPFDDALLDVRCLNALADRRTVQRKDPRRFGRVQVEEFRLFYNPMWSHFGDAVPPSGTYYYDQSNPEVDPLWNIFDQVLLRPALLDRFRSKNLKILTTDGMDSFVREDGRPIGKAYSDHLPIWFQIDLRRRGRHASK